ncbi:5'/3'-nucleotidase SurE [Nostoc sp.]|uniref:5'/3'-nucleotidase SurE n=1 Tax=Nostoc sp. TaxID=1180 RepID=UPI002FFA5E2E
MLIDLMVENLAAITGYAIAGTPSDCVRIALTQITADVKFVISGINAGGQLGSRFLHFWHSGCCAGSRNARYSQNCYFPL